MWDPHSRREVRQQRADAAVLQGLADQHLQRGPPRRRRAARRAHRRRHHLARCAGCARSGVEFMPTPGTYYDMLPERLAQLGIGSIDEDIDVLRELEILVDGEQRAQYLLQIFLKESAGLYDDPDGGAVLLRDHPAQGRSNGFGAGNFRALFESIEREQRDGAGCRRACSMLERTSSATVPTKHHIALRDAAGELRYEECLTRDGFDGPYTILYHRDRPHTQRLAPSATHGWAAPRRRGRGARPLAQAPLSDRSSSARAGGPPLDARVPLLFNARRDRSAVAAPDRADPVYFANGDGDELFYIHEGGGTLRTPLGDLRVRAGRLRLRAARPAAPLRASTSGAQYWLSIECAGGVAPAQAVAQRGRPAAHGRAVLRTATSSARVRRARCDEGIRDARREARRRASTASRYARLAARRRRLGRHGLSVGVPDPRLPAARRRSCTCRRRGTARSRRAARSSAASCRARSTSIPTPIPARIRTPRSTATSSSSTAAATSRRAAASAPGSISHHPAGHPARPAPGRLRGQHRRQAHRRARGDARHVPAAVTDGGGARVEDPGYHDSFL